MVEGGNQGSEKHVHKIEHELQRLTYTHGCEPHEKPRWCVYGKNRFGRIEVQHWIRPTDEDEFMARRIAKLENDLGGDMKAHMTEWNPRLKGEPMYRQKQRDDDFPRGPFGPDLPLGA